MGQEYRYVSENTLKHVSLHDCDCAHLYYTENRLVFEMEWMEVLKGHPLNPYEQAHQSGKGRIELLHPKLVECTILKKDGESLVINDIRVPDYSDIEFLEFEEVHTKENKDVYRADMYMIFYERDCCYGGIALSVEYRKALIMWDDLGDVSWFE